MHDGPHGEYDTSGWAVLVYVLAGAVFVVSVVTCFAAGGMAP